MEDSGDATIKTVSKESTRDLFDFVRDNLNKGNFSGFKNLSTGSEIVSVDDNLDYKNYNGGFWYNQQADKYKSVPYSSDDLKTSGCGIFSFVAILNSFVKGKYFSPEEIASYAYNNGIDTVATRQAFKSLAEHYKLPEPSFVGGGPGETSFCLGACKEEIDSSLAKGDKVIVNLQNEHGSKDTPGYWTSVGHYIVLTGKTDDGKYTVIDSMSEERTKNPQDASKIFGEGDKLPYAYFAVIFSPNKDDAGIDGKV